MARDGVTDNIDAMTKEEFWAAFAPLAKGMSAREIARELGTSFTSTARWVKGRSAPTAIARQPTVDKLRAVVEKRREAAVQAEAERAGPDELHPFSEGG